MFFQTDHLSQNFKNISRNTKNVAQTKKTTYSIPVTCEKNQQINFVNNCTEQSRLLPMQHHEINLPLLFYSPKCSYRNNFY